MKLLILSDVHGNQEALKSVLGEVEKQKNVEVCILLGDVIDYGMHSNEVVQILRGMPYPVLCNIRGNHEQAVLTDDYTRFSSERGRLCAQYTKSIISPETWDYIRHTMLNDGMAEFIVEGKRCLAVHGSLEDIYWKSINANQDLSTYQKYDYVFSGHSHLPHFFEVFYKIDDPIYRNRKKTTFINPGSVGQPRNLNPMAQFAILDTDTGELFMRKVPYDIRKEQTAFTGQVDYFYKERLERGI